MRVECEACHALVDAALAIDNNAITFECPSCRAHTTLQPEARGPKPEAPPATNTLTCPKCDRVRAGEPACPSCGLAADRMAGFAASREADVPATVRAAWDAALARWDDAGAHDAVFAAVAATNSYAWAAASYRDAARTRAPEIATRQLERIRRATEATLFATATPRDRAEATPYRNTIAILVFLVIGVIGLVAYELVSAPTDPGDDGGDAPPPAQVR